MKVTGSATLHAPAGRVWAALNDPAVLVRTIPGCERLEVSGQDSYRMTVTAGVASVKGTYAGEISLSDRHEPTSFLMKASGAGSPGTVSTSVRVRLADGGDGSTRLSYDADAVVGGMIAGVGQRMLTSVAKRMAEEFFSSVDGVLTGAVAGAATGNGITGAAQVPSAASVTSATSVVEDMAVTGGAGVAGPVGVPGPAGPPGQAQPGVFLAPPSRPPALAGGQGFLRGVLVGAAIALAGVAVGGMLGRRNR